MKFNNKVGFAVSRVALFSMFLFGMLTVQAQAQQIFHQQPTDATWGSINVFEFDYPGINPNMVQDAFMFYKFDGEVSYRQVPGRLNGNKFVVRLSLSGEQPSGQMEYYFEVILTGGQRVTFPDQNPSDTPVRIGITDPQKIQTPSQAVTGTVSDIEFTILSPMPGEKLLPDDALIAIALFYGEEVDLATDSLKLIINGIDVTANADISPFFISYVPKDFTPNTYNVELTYSGSGTPVSITSWNFEAIDPTSRAGQRLLIEAEGRKSYSGVASLNARNQAIFGNNQNILSGDFNVNGQAGLLRYNINGLFTTLENQRYQPQNRYGAEFYVGDFFQAQFGHIYPTISPLLLAGNRILGANAALNVFGILEFQATYGQLLRRVTNLYTPLQENLVEKEQLDGTIGTEKRYSLGFEDNGAGTYERTLMGGRLALGAGRFFKIGVSALKVRDDINSISTVSDFNSITPAQIADLNARIPNNELTENSFDVPGGNPVARDNFIVSTDVSANWFKNRFQFRSDAALSFLNNDISVGALSVERADELGIELDQDISDILKRISWFIIINENMSFLPFAIRDGEISGLSNRFLFMNDTPIPTQLMASQSTMSANFFNNNLSVSYRWVGPEFVSLANNTIRRDFAGIAIQDRFRMLKNTVYVTLGYEDFYDDLFGTRGASTVTQRYRVDLGWYPINRKLPRMNVGYLRQNRDNSIERLNPNLQNNPIQLLSAVQNFRVETVIVDGVPEQRNVILPTPRQSFTNQYNGSISQEFSLFDMSHSFNISYLNLRTTDQVFAFGDFSSDAYSAGLTTNWNVLPMRTNFALTYNDASGSSGLNNVEILGISAGVNYFMMDQKLNVFADVAYTTNKIENANLTINTKGTEDPLDDFFEADFSNKTSNKDNSYIFRGGAMYNISQNHAFMLDFSFTNVSSPGVPNDRILQARYVFRF